MNRSTEGCIIVGNWIGMKSHGNSPVNQNRGRITVVESAESARSDSSLLSPSSLMMSIVVSENSIQLGDPCTSELMRHLKNEFAMGF